MDASLGMTQNLEAKEELQLDHHVNIHMSLPVAQKHRQLRKYIPFEKAQN